MSSIFSLFSDPNAVPNAMQQDPILAQIMKLRQQQNNQQPSGGNSDGSPLQNMPGNGFTGSPGNGISGVNSSLNGLQQLSQLMGYQPNSTFGYNMQNSSDPNSTPQNMMQAGGIGGLLNNLFGSILF